MSCMLLALPSNGRSSQSDGLATGIYATMCTTEKSEFSSRQGQRNISLLHNAKTVSVTHPTFCVIYNWGFFPRDKAAGTWSWPLTSCADIRIALSYTSALSYVFMTWCLIKHRYNTAPHNGCLLRLKDANTLNWPSAVRFNFIARSVVGSTLEGFHLKEWVL
jgi:hypothetical protein